MDKTTFDELLERRIGLIRATLQAKRAEYATDGDVLTNFKLAAALRATGPDDALLGMLVKHWASIEDIVGNRLKRPHSGTLLLIDAKIGDAINYLILLEAVLKEPS